MTTTVETLEGARVALLCGDICEGRGPSCGAEGALRMLLDGDRALVNFDAVPYEDDSFGYRIVPIAELQLAGKDEDAPWRDALIRRPSVPRSAS